MTGIANMELRKSFKRSMKIFRCPSFCSGINARMTTAISSEASWNYKENIRKIEKRKRILS